LKGSFIECLPLLGVKIAELFNFPFDKIKIALEHWELLKNSKPEIDGICFPSFANKLHIA